jgi:DNA-binding NtrC family response regulator
MTMGSKRFLEGKRVLIVDDEPDVLDTLAELLSMCDIERASSYEEAREKLNAGGYDLAILDIMGVNGYALLELAAEKNITAVMLTAHALSPEDTIKSHKKGAAYYLPKEEMINIEQHLNDVLKALAEGKNTWWRWFDKFASFYERKFGPDWQEKDQNYWDKFKNYY